MEAKMKPLLITLLWCFAGAIICIILLTVGGCVQVIHERPDGTKLKVNTLFKETFFEGGYYDPNGFMELSKYKGIPSDVELVYDPKTGTFKFIAKGK